MGSIKLKGLKCKNCGKIIRNPNKKIFCSYTCSKEYHGDHRMTRTWSKR